MNQPSDYIAVFDSGVGGISVLRQLLRLMPDERYLYFGDTANAPYGTRSTQQVRQLALAATRELVSRGIKALVVACNTATAAAIQQLRSAYPQLAVIGIEPALKLGADRFPGGRVGVMATPLTLEAEKFHLQLQRFSSVCSVELIPAPGLSELVDAGKQNGPEGMALLQPLLAPYVGKLDALVLGCTHYPFAADTIRQILGPGTVLLDGGEGTAVQTLRILAAKGLLSDGPGEVRFLFSRDAATLLPIAEKMAFEK